MNTQISAYINTASDLLPDMAETAPEASGDESSFYSRVRFSLLSALIDVKQEDQRLPNSSTREDGEIEWEGGRRMWGMEG